MPAASWKWGASVPPGKTASGGALAEHVRRRGGRAPRRRDGSASISQGGSQCSTSNVGVEAGLVRAAPLEEGCEVGLDPVARHAGQRADVGDERAARRQDAVPDAAARDEAAFTVGPAGASGMRP